MRVINSEAQLNCNLASMCLGQNYEKVNETRQNTYTYFVYICMSCGRRQARSTRCQGTEKGYFLEQQSVDSTALVTKVRMGAKDASP